MTVYASKPEFNIREKLKELDGKQDKLLTRPGFLLTMGTATFSPATGFQNLTDWQGTGVNFFSTTIFDQGGNCNNGKFIAPYAGLYHFNFKLQVSYSSGYMYSYIYVNGGDITSVSCQFYQNNNVNTLSFTYAAKEGDFFEPYIQNNYSGGTAAGGLFSGHYIG